MQHVGRIRANAAKASVAKAAIRGALRARKEWRNWSEANRERGLKGHVEFSDRCAESRAYDHFADLLKLATHLARIAKVDLPGELKY